MSLDHLVAGAVYGLSLAIIAVAASRFTRQILAAALVVASMSYVGFALDAGASAAWLATGLLGAGIYGYAALRGTRGSAWWLVAGFALHPVWDVVLRYAGSGRGVAPEWYTTSSLSFDLMVAAISAVAILIGTHLTAAPSVQAVVLPLRPSTCACNSTSTCTANGARAA